MKSTKKIYVYFDDGFNTLQYLGDIEAFIDSKSEKIIEMAKETYLDLYTELYKFNISARVENYNKVIFYHDIDKPYKKEKVTPSSIIHPQEVKEAQKVHHRQYSFDMPPAKINEPPKRFEHPIIAYD